MTTGRDNPPASVNGPLAAELCQTGRQLIEKRLVAGTWGNISVRVARQLMLVTPSGRPYETLTEQDLCAVSLADGQQVSGRRTPSSESALHRAIYCARPEVRAIIHTHSLYASACAVARKPIPPVIEDLIQLVGGEVAVAAYALPGTEALATATVAALGDKQAVLLANHGAVACGESLSEALMIAEVLEKAAQIYLLAEQLGGACQLGTDDVQIMRSFYLERYRQRQKG